jgi:hypothetical protein
MKAILINGSQQSVEEISVDSLADIVALVGYETLEKDEVGPAGDVLYFDEECFLRGTEGRFQIDSLVPIAGKGVVIGSQGDDLADVHSTLAMIEARVKYL